MVYLELATAKVENGKPKYYQIFIYTQRHGDWLGALPQHGHFGTKRQASKVLNTLREGL